VIVDPERAEDGDAHGLTVDLFLGRVNDADISLIPPDVWVIAHRRITGGRAADRGRRGAHHDPT
jgi:hypothetical protein